MASKPFFDPKRKEWYLKYKPDPFGDWKKQKLGKHDAAVKPGTTPKPPPSIEKKAREFADIEFRAKHQLAPTVQGPRSLAGFLEVYAESHSLSNAKGSTGHVRRGIARFVEFAAGRGVTSIQGVNQSLCRDYLEMRSRVVAISTLKTERGFLMGAWTRALEDQIIPANPWTGARVKGRSTESGFTFWSPGEVAAIAAACSRPWQSDLVLFMANTGLRISTALAVRWSWINPSDHSLRLQKAPNVKTVYVHALSGAARAILERRKAVSVSPLVFPSENDEPIPYPSVKDAIDRAIARAKVPRGTPHDLRHTYGRSLALAGVPITVIKSQMGHSSIVMTQRYMTTDQVHAASFIEGLDMGGGGTVTGQ